MPFELGAHGASQRPLQVEVGWASVGLSCLQGSWVRIPAPPLKGF
jgi:hypothetical protein